MAGTDRQTQRFQLHVPLNSGAVRLDRFLSDSPDLGLTRTRVQKLIVDGAVMVDGRAVAKNFQLKGGEAITVEAPPTMPSELSPEDIELDIRYEDEFLVVVNKPAGMVTHPAAGHHEGTLVHALLHRYPSLADFGAGDRPGIVHRLDKETSGLLVVALTAEVHLTLQKAIQAREVTRTYLAVICGHMIEDEGEIDLPIGRSTRDRKKMAVTDHNSREAVTRFVVERRYRSYDRLRLQLMTGRTHQIRVHLAHLGHPVLGDPEYGGREKWCGGMFAPERLLGRRLLAQIGRQALHAWRLEFVHPLTHERLAFEAPIPGDLERVLDILETEG